MPGPIRVRFKRPQPAFAPGPDVPLQLRITWTPEALPVGEYMPTEALAALARENREARERA